MEIQSWTEVVVHPDVSDTVDRMLRGYEIAPERRSVGEDGTVAKERPTVSRSPNGVAGMPFGGESDRRANPGAPSQDGGESAPYERPREKTRIMPYGVNKGRLQQAVRTANSPVEVVDSMADADLLLTTKSYYRRKTGAMQAAERGGKPVYILRRNTAQQIEHFIRAVSRDKRLGGRGALDAAMREAEDAADRIHGEGERQIRLRPQNAYARHVQHEIAETRGLTSRSVGREPDRSVVFYGG